MTEENHQKSMSNNKKALILILFSLFWWIFIWSLLWEFTKEIFNISLMGILVGFQIKQLVFGEIIKKEFFLPHLWLIISWVGLIPLLIGFYIGRHSENYRGSNVFITVFAIMMYSSFNNYLLVDGDISSFWIYLILIGYFIFPLILGVVSVGALLGACIPCINCNSLHLTLYRAIFKTRIKGFIVLFIFIVLTIFSLEDIADKIKEKAPPYYHYFYAPVFFNEHPQDEPLLQISDSTKDNNAKKWSDTIDLNKGSNFELAIYYNNNTYLYQAINTRLALTQSDKNHFEAKLWAENAKSIQKSIKIKHNCDKPLFKYLNGNWYPIARMQKEKKTKPLLFDQTDQDIMKSEGINIGNIDGMWSGAGVFIVKFKYDCLDKIKSSKPPFSPLPP